MDDFLDNSTPTEISAVAPELYRNAPTIHRLFAKFRPFLCPIRETMAMFPPNSDVLDIGCGNGLLLGLLASWGRLKCGFGFDYSPTAIAAALPMALKAAQRNSAVRLGFKLRNSREPWPSGQYLLVSLTDVMHHVDPDEQQTLLLNAISFIRPGGLLVYKDMCRRPLLAVRLPSSPGSASFPTMDLLSVGPDPGTLACRTGIPSHPQR